jgi:hypothetical protein
MKSLIPDLTRRPYYIVTPNYTQASAGVRCMHLLCHWLNRKGERAYVLAYGGSDTVTNIDLLTPLLLQPIVEAHARKGLAPIVVYPEVVAGNPLNAFSVVRYVLNFPGLLGGDKVYDPAELAFGYSKTLAEACGPDTPVLHMPMIDRSIFFPAEARSRSGSAFYAHKYRDVLGQQVFGLPEGAVEITKGRPDSQTPEQIAEILRSVETFYVFENTALSIEATLCGCPCVWMPNPHLDKAIGLDELGWDGHSWGDSPEGVTRARTSVHEAESNYQRVIDHFFAQLDDFIARTQQHRDPRAQLDASAQILSA